MHLDHIDRTTKVFNISSLIGKSGFARKLEAEIGKVRLICADVTYQGKHWKSIEKVESDEIRFMRPLPSATKVDSKGVAAVKEKSRGR